MTLGRVANFLILKLKRLFTNNALFLMNYKLFACIFDESSLEGQVLATQYSSRVNPRYNPFCITNRMLQIV